MKRQAWFCGREEAEPKACPVKKRAVPLARHRARLPSVLPSFTSQTSGCFQLWPRMLARQRPKYCSTLYTGTMTLTKGCSVTGSSSLFPRLYRKKRPSAISSPHILWLSFFSLSCKIEVWQETTGKERPPWRHC